MINQLLKNKDNIEIIRDKIGVILCKELQNQYALALQYEPQPGEDFDPENYNIGIYIENKRPWEIEELPVINILVLGTKIKGGEAVINAGSAQGRQNYTLQYQIDCYAKGKHTEGGDDDRDGSNRAWIIARLARSILMAAEYTYLELRGIVGRRMITARNIVELENISNAAEGLSLCRMILDVDTFEGSPQPEFEILEDSEFDISTADGKIKMAGIRTSHIKEEEE